jgi:RNA polymerase sigma-70 factor (ECF subfamily)
MVDAQGWCAVAEVPEGPAEEIALLRAIRSGDREALEQLVSLQKQSLFALCHSILGHAEDAEDAVQETFLRALRALPRFRGEAAFRTWLLRIALNVCLNWKRDRRPSEPWDEAHPLSLTDADSPETIALRHLRMREALNALRPHYRVVFLLKEREGWSMAEIGAALQWNEKRVENALYQARRALAAWRQREAVEGEER